MTTDPLMENRSFSQLEEMNREGIAAIVVRGAGHADHREGWIDGLNEELIEKEIFENATTEHYSISVKPDRDDLVMVYGAEQKPNMGKMAMWRLGWQPTISWLEDWIVNDAKDFA